MTTKVWSNNAHDKGYTCLTYSRDGKHAYTGGSEGLVRLWSMKEGDSEEPEVATEGNEGITCLAAGNDCWFSGSEDSEVRRYGKTETDMDSLVTSATGLAIRAVAVDPKANRLAVASDELSVKIIDMDDTSEVFLLEAHEKGVRRVTWHPTGNLLTTCGEDGKIIVWDLTGEERKVETVIEGVIVTASPGQPAYQHDCSALWHPSGDQFFVTSRTNEVISISRSTWTKNGSFSDPSVAGGGPPTALAISPNGVYLAIAIPTIGISIWSTQTRRLLHKYDPLTKSPVHALAWVPNKNILGWTDEAGGFSRWLDVIPSDSPSPFSKASVITNGMIPVKRPAEMASIWGEDSVVDDTAMAEDEDDDDEAADPTDLDNFVIDDMGMGTEDEPQRGEISGKEFVSITKAQPAFQPGATSMQNKRRYLAHNMIGIIDVTDQDTHHIVNVEFHDRSLRKGFHWPDHFKFDLASLGERGAVFACPPQNDHPAQVTFKPYGNAAEWTYKFPKKGSRVLGVTAGGVRLKSSREDDDDFNGLGMIVIATSENDLTFITGEKQEMFVMGLDGDFVSMIAGPEWVCVIHRPGAATIDGSQNLMCSLISLEDFSVHQRMPLPVPKGHTVKWIGITEEGAPAVYDSTGMIHVMINFRKAGRGNWARVLDTNQLERKQGKDESYWPVGLNKDIFHCLILKGRQEYPGFPRPLIQELPMRMPFRGTDSKETQLEEVIAREQFHLNFSRDSLGEELTTDAIAKREMEQDKRLIVLIQSACKANASTRVLSLVGQLHHLASFDTAIKVADFYHLVGLQEKIRDIKDERHSEDRLETARDRRREWQEEQASPPRRTYASSSRHSRPDLLGGTGPPSTVYRPGLAPANPVVETSRFSNANVSSRPSQSHTSTFEDDSPSPEGKRRRTQDDESQNDPGTFASNRMTDTEMGPPKTKPNPFAKKPGQDVSRNPFSRKADGDKTIHKSESFFDKVDAFESSEQVKKLPIKSKDQNKRQLDKPVARQTTLFGLPGSNSKPKEKVVKKKKGNNGSQVSTQSDITMSEPNSFVDETQLTESQSGDTQPADVQGAETQLDETQLEETQLVDEPLDDVSDSQMLDAIPS